MPIQSESSCEPALYLTRPSTNTSARHPVDPPKRQHRPAANHASDCKQPRDMSGKRQSRLCGRHSCLCLLHGSARSAAQNVVVVVVVVGGITLTCPIFPSEPWGVAVTTALQTPSWIARDGSGWLVNVCASSAGLAEALRTGPRHAL